MVKMPLDGEGCAKLDAAKARKGVALRNVRQEPVLEGSPNAIHTQKVEAAQDCFESIHNNVAHVWNWEAVVKPRWAVHTNHDHFYPDTPLRKDLIPWYAQIKPMTIEHMRHQLFQQRLQPVDAKDA